MTRSVLPILRILQNASFALSKRLALPLWLVICTAFASQSFAQSTEQNFDRENLGSLTHQSSLNTPSYIWQHDKELSVAVHSAWESDYRSGIKTERDYAIKLNGIFNQFQVRDNDLYYVLQSTSNTAIMPSLAWEGYSLDMSDLDASEREFYSGIRSRGKSLMLGINIATQLPNIEIMGGISRGVSGKHSGYKLSGKIHAWQHLTRRISIGLHVDVQNLSLEPSRYYFGVTDAEAQASSFTAYEPKNSWIQEYAIEGRYKFVENFSLVTRLQHTIFDKTITNSPLIKTDNFSGLFVGFELGFDLRKY